MNPLVEPAWLAGRLGFANTVIIDASLAPVGVTPAIDTRARYLSEHIPGAVFFDIDELSDRSTSLPHMLPTAEDFGRSMSQLGIGDDQTIVIYEQEGVYSAPRAWWMLRSFGATRVYVLNGGLRAWMKAGYSTESGRVERPPADFQGRLDPSAVKDFAAIQQMLAQGAQVIDARSADRFSGAAPEPRPGISSGHMPGAINVPFTDVAEDGRIQDAGKLRELFAARGVKLSEALTTSCGSGVTAAVVLLALEIAGATQVSIYDGSWAEYAQRPEAIIEKDV